MSSDGSVKENFEKRLASVFGGLEKRSLNTTSAIAPLSPERSVLSLEEDCRSITRSARAKCPDWKPHAGTEPWRRRSGPRKGGFGPCDRGPGGSRDPIFNRDPKKWTEYDLRDDGTQAGELKELNSDQVNKHAAFQFLQELRSRSASQDSTPKPPHTQGDSGNDCTSTTDSTSSDSTAQQRCIFKKPKALKRKHEPESQLIKDGTAAAAKEKNISLSQEEVEATADSMDDSNSHRTLKGVGRREGGEGGGGGGGEGGCGVVRMPEYVVGGKCEEERRRKKAALLRRGVTEGEEGEEEREEGPPLGKKVRVVSLSHLNEEEDEED